MNIKRYQVILAFIGIIIAMGIAGNMDVQEGERQHAEYREMVKLWEQTNGKHGWPAYNGGGTCQKEKDNDWPLRENSCRAGYGADVWVLDAGHR